MNTSGVLEYVRELRAKALPQLDRLNGEQHANKMKMTILFLAARPITGETMKKVFERTQTGGKTAYRDKWSKHHKVFMEVETAVKQMVSGDMIDAGLSSIAQATYIMQTGAPDAARKIVSLVETAEDERVQMQSAKIVLDGASSETAGKSAAVSVTAVFEGLDDILDKAYGGDDGEDEQG